MTEIGSLRKGRDTVFVLRETGPKSPKGPGEIGLQSKYLASYLLDFLGEGGDDGGGVRGILHPDHNT